MGGFDEELHLHGLYRDKRIALLDGLSFLHKYLHDSAWHWALDNITLRLYLSTDNVFLLGDFVFKRLTIEVIEGNLTICADRVVKLAL